ncbi:putative pyridoxal-phosphate-dependent aminotransferase [Desulforapulum autotrophicum HRM2]|uniref:Pyridoxal-phosphate-dependent aminotransferase n=1 Tax=Desulforapulum autotrophicum (strain ATCC 43914 / DSM 3382 / VKM B-1955 / HRM2) TaxID=177437 RepID=C0QA26_DESAH|nr:putative pyridoxal-phosphate-dependent aminotransferase [Desulforapulum autotrophicum HRM2]
MGATGIKPGEEMIVSPYTMSASAVAPLVYNAIPIFAGVWIYQVRIIGRTKNRHIINSSFMSAIDLHGKDPGGPF